MKRISPVLMLLFSCLAHAQDRHLTLAMKFDEVSSSFDKGELVDNLLPMMIRANPKLDEKRTELRQRLLSLVQSEEFKIGKAKVYIELFTEAELESLIALFSNPAYIIFNDRRFEVNKKLLEYSMPKYLEVADQLDASL